MTLSALLGFIGLGGAVLCVGAYVYSFIYNVRGFRPLAVLSLFSTIIALVQLAMMLTQHGGPPNVGYAMLFLVISGLAQSISSLKGRDGRS